jgi:hypothetical protein
VSSHKGVQPTGLRTTLAGVVLASLTARHIDLRSYLLELYDWIMFSLV